MGFLGKVTEVVFTAWIVNNPYFWEISLALSHRTLLSCQSVSLSESSVQVPWFQNKQNFQVLLWDGNW